MTDKERRLLYEAGILDREVTRLESVRRPMQQAIDNLDRQIDMARGLARWKRHSANHIYRPASYTEDLMRCKACGGQMARHESTDRAGTLTCFTCADNMLDRLRESDEDAARKVLDA